MEHLNDVKDRSPSEKQQDEDDDKLRDVKTPDNLTEESESQDLSALDDQDRSEFGTDKPLLSIRHTDPG